MHFQMSLRWTMYVASEPPKMMMMMMSAFIKWSGWTLAMTMSWWQHDKHCRGYYYYYYYYCRMSTCIAHYAERLYYAMCPGAFWKGVSSKGAEKLKMVVFCSQKSVLLGRRSATKFISAKTVSNKLVRHSPAYPVAIGCAMLTGPVLLGA